MMFSSSCPGREMCSWEEEKLTYGIFWWQVDGVCVQVLQKGAIHKVGELVDLDGVLVCLVQQVTEMLTPEGRRAGEAK